MLSLLLYVHVNAHIFSDGSRWLSFLLYFIVNQSDIVDWGYTVGHPDLIDVDARRGGPWGKQTSIEAIMERLIVDLTQRRRYNFYKIIPTPLKICYLDSKELEYANLTEFLELDENQEKWCDTWIEMCSFRIIIAVSICIIKLCIQMFWARENRLLIRFNW